MKAVLVLLCAYAFCVFAHSSHYYDMIEDIIKGVNYYDVLGLDKSANEADVKKAHRLLSMKYHPDKNPGAKELYLNIQRAREILEDPFTRSEYNKLLTEGIPLLDKYNTYVRRYNIPQHDIRVVLACLLVIATIAKYLYQWHRHEVMMERARNTTLYRLKKNEMKREKERAESSSKKRNNTKESDDGSESDEEDELEIRLTGTEMPTWRDILIIQILMLPYTITMIVYRCMKPLTQEEREKLICEKYGWTKEEFEAKKKKSIERYQRLINSSKMKKARRMWKKHLYDKGALN